MNMTLNNERLLDSISWQILKVLQENARLSFSEIGRRVGLSSPAVAERVQRLEEAGIITGYHAHIDTTRLGYQMTALVRISSYKDRHSQVVPVVSTMPEVIECHCITGSDCFLLRVMVASVQHLEAILTRLKEFGETTTSIVLSSPIPLRVIEYGPDELTEVCHKKF